MTRIGERWRLYSMTTEVVDVLARNVSKTWRKVTFSVVVPYRQEWVTEPIKKIWHRRPSSRRRFSILSFSAVKIYFNLPEIKHMSLINTTFRGGFGMRLGCIVTPFMMQRGKILFARRLRKKTAIA
ncbi:hypothetical protein JCM18909_1740 [Cutibacterium acnes JCM 18909]|nr:hypothetical protein JCM18909_1740 [Cutibacterium acnes JCM 18909]